MNVTAKEINGHRIRIEGPIDQPVGFAVSIKDLDIGQMIDNVGYLSIAMLPSKNIIAHLVLFHVGELEPNKDGGLSASVCEETVTVHNPEVAVTAFVGDPND